MKIMSDNLPDNQIQPVGQQPMSTVPPVTPAGAVGTAFKEGEPAGVSAGSESLPLSEIGREVQISPDVRAAGVKVVPQIVPVPPQLTNHGVVPTGNNVPLGNGSSIKLPLSDDQIAQGMETDVKNSWMWLAVWCIRRLKQIHITVKLVKGKLMRGVTA